MNGLDGLYILEMIYEIQEFLKEKGTQFKKQAFLRLRELEVKAASKKSLFAYTRDVLEALKNRGIRRGIMTRTCLDAVSTVFPDYKEYVEAVVTREEVDRVKPHPNHVVKILEVLCVEAKEAMIAGDHPTDVMAGQALGIKTVGVLTGRTAKEEFLRIGATYILSDIRGIIDIV